MLINIEPSIHTANALINHIRLNYDNSKKIQKAEVTYRWTHIAFLKDVYESAHSLYPQPMGVQSLMTELRKPYSSVT